MSVLHDMACPACGVTFENQPLTLEGQLCGTCASGRLEILWGATSKRDAAVHSSERTALFYSAKENKFSYPGRNDQPIPDRLKRRGYERVEFSSLKSVEQHEKQTGTRSEMAWFDRGSGRSFDEP